MKPQTLALVGLGLAGGALSQVTIGTQTINVPPILSTIVSSVESIIPVTHSTTSSSSASSTETSSTETSSTETSSTETSASSSSSAAATTTESGTTVSGTTGSSTTIAGTTVVPTTKSTALAVATADVKLLAPLLGVAAAVLLV